MNKYKASKWVYTNKLTIEESFLLLDNCKCSGDPLLSNGISKAQSINKLKCEINKYLDECGFLDMDLCKTKPELAKRIIRECL